MAQDGGVAPPVSQSEKFRIYRSANDDVGCTLEIALFSNNSILGGSRLAGVTSSIVGLTSINKQHVTGRLRICIKICYYYGWSRYGEYTLPDLCRELGEES